MDIDLSKLEEEAKCALAKSKFVETEVLEFLSKDKISSVRENVAANSNSTYAILRKLSNDTETKVRLNVAKNPITPSKILKSLAEDKSSSVRFEVSKNINTSSETLDFLSYDKYIAIKRNVAINKNTSPETLTNLATGQLDFGIQYFVAHNENTPEKVKKRLKSKLPTRAWAMVPTIEMLDN